MSKIRSYGWRGAAVALAMGVTISLLAERHTALAKEFEMLGTIDCGKASSAHCPPGDSLTLFTTAITGVREQFVIDTSWIRNQLESAPQRQDDLICLLVEERPGIGYRALAVRDSCEDIVSDDNEEDDRKREREDDRPN